MLDSYFKISQRGSTVGQEVRGGVVTFFTMAYIVALNPLIIGLAKDGDGKFLGGGVCCAAYLVEAGVGTLRVGHFLPPIAVSSSSFVRTPSS